MFKTLTLATRLRKAWKFMDYVTTCLRFPVSSSVGASGYNTKWVALPLTVRFSVGFSNF